MKCLWTDRFIRTIQRALQSRHIHVSTYRVEGASEAFLHSLKMTRRIDEKMVKLYYDLIEEDETKIQLMNDVVDFWKANN